MQRLDHFNYKPDSYSTFPQRYIINFKHWGGAKSNAPIFAYFGAEEPMPEDIYVGLLEDNAPKFNALVVYIEHRYYGNSTPFGSFEESMKNETTRGYFNSAQAIADYADVLLHIKNTWSAQHSPIIIFGGSYGGMLASWFRLKYPHVALGALASSAPILYFDGIAPHHGYFYVVTKDFRETSESCYNTIRKSWYVIDRVAKKPNGLSILSNRFKTCKKLSTSSNLKNYLILMYSGVAQYNDPHKNTLKVICDAIDGAANKTDVLGQIFEGVVAYDSEKQPCYEMEGIKEPSETDIGYAWQTCSEMVMPIGIDREDSLFQPNPFNMKEFVNYCKNQYGVVPQPHWVTTYYGGSDLKLNFKRFASNIIFSNGLMDPYSSGEVLNNISDSIIALTTKNGSHCLDLRPVEPSDPLWLTTQRNTEVKIIKGWIDKYQADLRNSTK
ncbi:hypothetical protein TanjilG_14015 [Lupinus angustifolius]|uniref:Lysosomal Pro-X carboxypeptidase n=2 Tax=Lupinus angustifolius TaxID=3871 RepID=A0A1J7GN92_LUPAN|nr:hypothetical protein TanjilG_14015 [Lupinus angustifolius]